MGEQKLLLKNTTMLYLINITKMLLPIAIIPYFTRIFSVHVYAIFIYVQSLKIYMTLISDFGFSLSATKSIANSIDKIEHGIIIGETTISRAILSLLAICMIMFFSLYVPLLQGNYIFVLLSCLAILTSIGFVDFYFQGIEKMQTITIRFVIMKLFTTILTFLLVKEDKDLVFIPILDIVGNLAATFFSYYEIRKDGVRFAIKSYCSIVKRTKESLIYFASNIANTAFNALNMILVGLYLQASDVAMFGVAGQINGGIQQFFFGPIVTALYPRMVKTRSKKMIVKILTYGGILVICGCILVYLFSGDVVRIISGTKYLKAQIYVNLHIPVLFFSFFAMIFGFPTLGAIGKQREVTISTFIACLVQTGGLFLLVMLNKFTLFNICILRCSSELVLMLSRGSYCLYYRYLLRD